MVELMARLENTLIHKFGASFEAVCAKAPELLQVLRSIHALARFAWRSDEASVAFSMASISCRQLAANTLHREELLLQYGPNVHSFRLEGII